MNNKNQKIKDALTSEIRLKDIIIGAKNREIEGLKQDVKKLNTTLRIPKLQREFLEEKGSLDVFVEAAALGKDEVAKWVLLNTGRKEIGQILKEKNALPFGPPVQKLESSFSVKSSMENQSSEDIAD